MRIDSVIGKLVDGRPLLSFNADGRQVVFDNEAKRAIRKLGYVHLGARWESLLPAVVISEDAKVGRPEHTLYGFTNDPEVLRLFDAYMQSLDDGSFKVGRWDWS